MEPGNWFEVEARKGKQMVSEVLDIDEWETEMPETEVKNHHHIWKSLAMIK